MDTFNDDSLYTTAPSMDFTFEESQCLSNTPLKNVLPVFPTQYHDPQRMPTPKPTTPNGVRRTIMEDVSAAVAQSLDNSKQKLRSMSFKRQRLEVRLNHLQRKTLALRVRDEAIKGRHKLLHDQRFRMAEISSGSSIDDSSSDVTKDSKRLLTSPGHALTTSLSHKRLEKIHGNSVVKRSSHKVIYRPSTDVIEDPCFHKTTISRKTSQVICQQTDAPSITYKRVQKVKKTPSSRLKRFVLKKLRLLLK